VKRPGVEPVTNTLNVKFDAVRDGQTLVELSGAIDENSDVQGMFERLPADAVLNMRAVERVNSMGVHRWVPLVTRFSAKQRLLIDEISYPLVQNANSVANMFGTAQVRSCMAPYYCARCQDNVTVPVTASEVAATDYAPPDKQCGRCRSMMEFDELDGYFAFFKNRAGR